MPNDTIKEVQTVPIRRLDNYIKEKKLVNIKLIKIDTEGFEFPVLKGLCNYFESCSDRAEFRYLLPDVKENGSDLESCRT